MDIIFVICAIFVFGLIFGGIAKKLKFPEVTGYLIGGIIMGPSVLKVLDASTINSVDIFSTIALSFISFMVGAEFKWKYVKKLGKKPFIIGIMSSFTTLLLVTIALMFFNVDFTLALVLGAIASSTAPAAIMMIVKEYKAQGELTKNMLSVIAIDDVLSIFTFGFVIVIAEYINFDGASLVNLLEPFKEIFISLILGTILGLLLGVTAKLFKSQVNTLCLIIIHVFAGILICSAYDIEALLMCMVMGAIFVNAYNLKVTDRIMDAMDYISAPILIIFFVVSGASLEFGKIESVLTITIVFIIARAVGKIFGSTVGAVVSKSSKEVIHNIGPTLLSQTGLAIGLAMIAKESFPSNDNLITIIIASSFVFDMVGPLLTKVMLKRSKNIR